MQQHDIRGGVLAFRGAAAKEDRAVFFDRDGTVIEELRYARDPAQVRLRQGIAASMAEARRRGYALVVISNQSGVGRGILKPDDVVATHARMVELLAAAGVWLDASYYCLHHPDAGCACRKPGIAMLVRASVELGLRLSESLMIGDKESDLEAGRRAGCMAAAAHDDWIRFSESSSDRS
jgi:D-glycero-D-manno-heptose 1,7-bisphosphate phosphatase